MLHGLEIEAVARPILSHDAEADAADAYDERIPLYRLLSGVFLQEPDAGFLGALREPQALASLADAGLAFDDDFLATSLPVMVDELAAEFATLFAASGGFPPVESVRLTGRYKQEPYFAVQQTYRRAGFAVRRGRFHVFEDQLGLELAFAAELLERCATAEVAGDEDALRRWERELRRFWTVHLGKWVRGYARLVQRAAEHSFYREMARLLEAFAEREIALLRLRIDDLDQARQVVPKAEVAVAFNPDEPVCGACPGSR